MLLQLNPILKPFLIFMTVTLFCVPGVYASDSDPSGLLIASNTGGVTPVLSGGVGKGELNTLDTFQEMVLSDLEFPTLIKVHLPRIMHVYEDSVKRKLVWQELIYTELALVDRYQIERFERVAASCSIRL